MNASKKDLLVQEWEVIYNECDIDKAHDTFLTIFKSLYEINYLIFQVSRKQTNKHWATMVDKGIAECL